MRQKTSARIYLILEFCVGGDLQKFIRSQTYPHQKRLSEATAQHFLLDLGELRFGVRTKRDGYCCIIPPVGCHRRRTDLRSALCCARRVLVALVALALRSAEGLDFIWSKHLIHRDLKPQVSDLNLHDRPTTANTTRLCFSIRVLRPSRPPALPHTPVGP